MQTKKLSIIIPHYNSRELVRKLIDSIPIRKEIQVILVDDNSTENIDDLREYAKCRQIEFYQNDSSEHSAGRCRNIGLKHAVGEWLLFADADDYFLPGFYDSLVPYFELEYDIIYFPLTSIRLTDGQRSNRHFKNNKLIHNYSILPTKENEVKLRYKQVEPWSKLIRASLVKENAIFFEQTRVANDVIFSMKCAACAKKITTGDKTIYCVTASDKSLTTSVKREDVMTRIKMTVKKYKYLRGKVDKETWKILDLRGDKYIKLFKEYGIDKRDILWVWGYMIVNGVRPCVSRNITIFNFIPTLIKKIFRR